MKPSRSRTLRCTRWGFVAVSAVLAVASFMVAPARPAGAAGAAHALIVGSGSSWAGNAVQEWVADVAQQGIQVVYTPDGDAQGRQDFANRTSDFAVTSIGYQGKDPVTGVNDTSDGRLYSYLPIAAGGTSFPYHIVVDGQRVTNLRLSGETIAKIFTNQITNWDDPEITADNNGHKLPDLPIVPVVQSEGSGATAQLTTYFATEFPSIWRAYSGASTFTEYYPRQGDQIAQNGSSAAMNYVSSSVANGSIGYVEYSYPLDQNWPVALMENKGGYYTLPTQYNVAVSLEKAQINMDKSSPDYLLQTLTNVYNDTDPRTYPLSSYVYEIEPTGVYPNPESKITPAKRQSIADFTYYAICQGQREIGPIGYSPLPVNLVEAGFGQIEKLKQADPSLDLDERNIDTCDNPTFIEGHPNTNYLAQIAPFPPSCDKQGAGPCVDETQPNTGVTTTTGPGNDGEGGGTTTSTTMASTDANPGGNSGVGPSGGGSNTVGKSQGKVTINPNNGQPEGTGTGTGGAAPLVSASLAGYSSSNLTGELAPLAAALLLLAFILPPVIGYRHARRRRGDLP